PSEAMAGRLAPASAARTLADCGLRVVRTRPPDPRGLIALVSHMHMDATTQRFLDQYALVDKIALSSSLKFGLLARGEADVYARAGNTSEWDTAAGHAVLAAAGGSVTTFDGAPLLYGKLRFRNPGFIAWGREPLPPSRAPQP